MEIVSTKKEFEKIGFVTDFFDIDYTSPRLLVHYDIIHFNGGNPFYLLNQIRKTNALEIIKELLFQGKVISGSSAGSIVLGENISLILEFDPQMNEIVNLTNFKGVNITNINLCPHYSKYINR